MPVVDRAAHRERNRKRKTAYRAKKSGIEVDAFSEEVPEDLELNIEPEKVERPVQSLGDRIKEHFQQAKEGKPRASDKQKADRTESLLATVLPMTLSGMVALYSRNFFSEEYKACAPTRDEVASILLPVFSVIARHVEVEGKASQDALDLFTALLSSITVTTRMIVTYQGIKNGYIEQSGQQTETSNISQFRGSAGNNRQATPPTPVSYPNGTFPAGSPGHGKRDEPSGTINGDDGSTDERSREAAQVAMLFKRDSEGRKQMGLL